MSVYYCAACKCVEVSCEGELCENCALPADPFAAAARPTSGRPAKTRKVLLDEPPSDPVFRCDRVVLVGSAASAMDEDPDPAPMTTTAIAASGPAAVQPSSNSNPALAKPSGGSSLSASSPKSKTNPRPDSAAGSYVYVRGIAKNVIQDADRRGAIFRWFRSVFRGPGFALDPDITEFQLYPDFSGQTLNSSGNLADQVIIYGKVKFGMISENNDVEVYGRRDREGNIVAKSVKNTATGAVAKPSMALPRAAVIAITLILAALLVSAGLIWGLSFYLNILGLVLFIVFFPYIMQFFMWLVSLFMMVLMKIE